MPPPNASRATAAHRASTGVALGSTETVRTFSPGSRSLGRRGPPGGHRENGLTKTRLAELLPQPGGFEGGGVSVKQLSSDDLAVAKPVGPRALALVSDFTRLDPPHLHFSKSDHTRRGPAGAGAGAPRQAERVAPEHPRLVGADLAVPDGDRVDRRRLRHDPAARLHGGRRRPRRRHVTLRREIPYLEDAFGLTPASRVRLRWEIGPEGGADGRPL